MRAGAVSSILLSTSVWVREGHDAPVQAPAPPARLLLKRQMLLLKHIFTYFYRPLRFYAQAQCLRAGAVSSSFGFVDRRVGS